MKIGLFKTSLKENERRVPIYPEHLPFFPESLRAQMLFEKNYGYDYGFTNDYFVNHDAAIVDRHQLLTECDLVVLPKPTPEDLGRMKPHQILFGWTHVVQQKAMTQLAIDRRLTIIAWEAMHNWSEAGERLLHVFYKNNEIAGYASVLHCLQLLGLDGHYGPRRKVIILSYGSVSRGAIYALQGRGFNNIYVFTRRPPHLVADQNPDVYYGQYYFGLDGILMAKSSEDKERPLIDELSDADIICNGILQDTNKSVMFVRAEDIHKLKPRSLIIDISCDEGMGFAFARPTSFPDPIFQVGDQITYYSVDHTPTYLWNAASREISKALLPYLGIVAAGENAWQTNTTIRRAVEIRDGVIQNPNILSFQKRHSEYPHKIEPSP
jgi:N5-(carboxyethyl)ornithine synthase